LDIGGALRATADPSAAATDPTSNRLQALSYYFNSGYRVAGGTQGLRLVLSISRRARASGARPLDTRGGSYFFLDIPSASDVLSFEFPSLQKATEDLLKGHTFSLRIRVTPVGK